MALCSNSKISFPPPLPFLTVSL